MSGGEHLLDSSTDTYARREILRRCPNLQLHRVIRSSAKTVLYEGTWEQTRVVAKYLLDHDPFWMDTFRGEIRAYKYFETCPPPVRIPRLLDADHQHLIVLEFVAGTPVLSHRHPSSALHADHIEAVLTIVTQINRWRPPEHVFDRIYNYSSR